jgi:ankyrin repeat protein
LRTDVNSGSRAISGGYSELCQVLLGAGADVRYRCVMNKAEIHGVTPLHNASFTGHSQVWKLLLESGASVSISNMYGYMPLHRAAGKGRRLLRRILPGVSSVAAHDQDGGRA